MRCSRPWRPVVGRPPPTLCRGASGVEPPAMDVRPIWEGTIAIAINERGQVIGDGGIKYASHANVDWHAFSWQNGKMADLALLSTQKGGTLSHAAAVNDRGQVVGSSDTRTGVQHGFLWQQGRIQDLGTLAGKNGSEAIAINKSGQIAGNSFTYRLNQSPMNPRAFVWQNGRMVDLGTLGGKSSTASAINDLGQVVGWSETKSGARHAFLWQDGRMRDLGSLPGKTESTAAALNERGEVVGYSFAKLPNKYTPFPLPDEHTSVPSPTITQLPRAFVWRNGKMTALATPGAHFSWAVAINDRGQIIGNTFTPSSAPGVTAWQGSTRGITWQGGNATYLPVPRGATSYVSAINDRGQIVGLFSPRGPGGLNRAALWDGGKLTDLGGTEFASGEDPHAGASALNLHDQIVGAGSAMMDFSHALLWSLRPGN